MSHMYKSKKSSKFNRQRFSDRKNFCWNRNSPSSYNNCPNFTDDFSRRPDTFYPHGFPPQNFENPINRPPFDIPNPNFQFQNPSLDIRTRCDDILSQFPDPGYDYVPPFNQNLRSDYYRDYEVDSFRFPPWRSEFPNEELIEEMNSARDFPRRSDSHTPREKGRYCKNYKKSREFSGKYGSVSPRFKERTRNNYEVRSFANDKQAHGSSRRYDDVSRMETKEKSKESPILKMSPDRKRKRSTESPRVEVKKREKSQEGAVAKLNPSNGSSKNCDDISPQIEVNNTTREVPNKSNTSQVLAISVTNSEPNNSCDNPKIRKVNAARIFPKNCGSNSKECPIGKMSPTRDVTKTCDADPPRVEAKIISNLDSSSDLLGKCGGSPQVQSASEILNKAEPFVDLTSVENNEPKISAMRHSNFKIRKISADRKFPKHCGPLAPPVAIRRNYENLVVVEKDNTKVLVGKHIDGIESGVEVKTDDVEELLNEPILPKDFEMVENETVSLNDVKKVSNRPISTNAHVESARAKSFESFETLNDHAVDLEDNVTPIEEQNQSSADISLDCEYEKDRNEKCNSPIYSSDFELSQSEEYRSESEDNLVDAAYLYHSDLLPNEDKIKSHSGVSVDCEKVGKRKQVKETLDTYDRILTKLVEANKAALSIGTKKVSSQAPTEAAMLLKRDKKWVNTEQVIGHVAGIEVGDRFRFRAELVCIGLHRIFQAGIDYMKTEDGNILATSIVDSGRYANDAESSDVLIYCGQGGNPNLGKDKRPQDQKLERGNLAMKNSMEAKTPVRVIRKVKKSVVMYYYDGLYVVTKVIQERTSYGKLAYKFQLDRIVSDVANVTQVEKLPFLVEDISLGKEKIPINAVNTIDNEPFPVFKYISKMTYPESCYRHINGCDCADDCADTNDCVCIAKNGNKIPFDDEGAIVVKPKSKRFIYECGPSCKCPSSCKNRVSQYGIRYPLEVFKTKSMGWGVRSRNYIPAGSFICEYVGELLQDEEAEQRHGNDEYLFDIDRGYTIDAANYGNVGRFINHSCSPNLYAQNVLYDHGNKQMPHVMFFAVNGVYPNEELTYDYNYKLDKVLDSEGNIKRKDCHCGSRRCTGRLY